MASHHLAPAPEAEAPSPPTRDFVPAPKAREPLAQNTSILISVLVHGLAFLIVGLSALFAPKAPSVVPIFEIVNLEKPKLRPLTPKVQKPPEPPPPEPEPVKPPDAPKLTPKPTKAVDPVKKPEPKVVKEDPEPKVVKEAPVEQQVLQPQAQISVPQDPRLSLWAARVNKKVDQLWHPPAGIEVSDGATVHLIFKVSRDGSVSSAAVSESSGNAGLDDVALMTIRRLETVPPIPENFENNELEVGCALIYHGQ